MLTGAKNISVLVCTFILAIIIGFPVFGQNANRVQIAVMSLETSGFDASAVIILTDRLRSELMNTGKFDVMERSRMDELLKEQGFQQTGLCNNNECIVEVGNILGVRRMVISSFGRVGKMYSISARIVDIQNGRILISKSEDCECPIEEVLTKSIRNLAYKLAGIIIPQQTASVPIPNKAKLSISGNPVGAKITLDNKNIGIMPIKNVIVSLGQYNLDIKLSGYEDGKYWVKFAAAENKVLRINLTLKSKPKAMLRSLVFPGLGQKYSEHTVRAIIFPLLELAAIGGAVWANNEFTNAANLYTQSKQDYINAITEDEINLSRTEMDKKYKTATAKRDQRTLIIGAAAGIWIWNVIDTAIWGPKIKVKNKYSHSSLLNSNLYYCDEIGLAKIELSYPF